MTDEQTQNNTTVLNAANSLKNAGIRIATVRISDIQHDPVCGSSCFVEDMTRIANSVYANNPAQPRGAFRCLEVCDGNNPINNAANLAAFRSLVLGSVCAFNLSALPSLPSIVQTPSQVPSGQDMTLDIPGVTTTAGLVDYQWQRERADIAGTWENLTGACASAATVESGRPPPCADKRYRCVVSTPCDQDTTPTWGTQFAPGQDCNQDGVADICQWIPGYQWTGTVGATATDLVGGDFTFTSNRRDDASGTAVGPSGEILYTGNFAGTSVNLNPFGTPPDSRSSSGGTDDGFITKLTAAGNYAWSDTFGGSGADKGYCVAVDQQDGSVYVAGTFRGASVDLSSNAGGCQCFSTVGIFDTFINKYTAAGSYQWTRVLHGLAVPSMVKPLAITVAADNRDVIVVGWYQSDVDFGASGTSDIRYTGTPGANGWRNGFITRLTSAGTYVRTRIIATKASGLEAVASGVITDTAGITYVCGWYYGTSSSPTDFDPPAPADGQSINLVCPCTGPCTAQCRYGVGPSTDAFLMKLSASGNFVWVQSMGSTGIDLANGLALDGFGNVFVCGKFQNTASFDPSNQPQMGCDPINQPYCHQSNGLDDAFLVKLSASSGAHIWTRTFGSANADVGIGVAADPSGNAIITGYFCRSGATGCKVDFDAGATTKDVRTSAGGSDVFVTQFNADGSYGWTHAFGSGGTMNNNDEGRGVAVTPGCA